MRRSQNRYRRIKSAQREADFVNVSEQMERRADPFEQAKTFLQSKGWAVYRDECGGWFIGRKRGQSDADLVRMAERLGWKSKPSDRDWRVRTLGIKKECEKP